MKNSLKSNFLILALQKANKSGEITKTVGFDALKYRINIPYIKLRLESQRNYGIFLCVIYEISSLAMTALFFWYVQRAFAAWADYRFVFIVGWYF